MKFFFAELEAIFCKRYWIMQTNEQVYMALQVIKQGGTKKVKVYYDRIRKLANCLQHKANDNLLTIFYKVGLISYLRVVIADMQCNSPFEHKEIVVTCEENMGDPIEYQKLLEPLKSNKNNDGKCIGLVCSQCKKKGYNKEHYHWNLKTPNNRLNEKKKLQ